MTSLATDWRALVQQGITAARMFHGLVDQYRLMPWIYTNDIEALECVGGDPVADVSWDPWDNNVLTFEKWTCRFELPYDYTQNPDDWKRRMVDNLGIQPCPQLPIISDYVLHHCNRYDGVPTSGFLMYNDRLHRFSQSYTEQACWLMYVMSDKEIKREQQRHREWERRVGTHHCDHLPKSQRRRQPDYDRLWWKDNPTVQYTPRKPIGMIIEWDENS